MRRELGVEAFGINWFELPPNAEGREHDESDTGQEEVNVIIRGSGVYRIEDEEVPFSAGTIFRFDAQTTRQPVAGPNGFTMVAIGAGRAATNRGVRSDLLRPVYASTMTTIELTPDEVQLVRSALKAFLDDFGHEEMDVIRRLQAILAKLPEESPPPTA